MSTWAKHLDPALFDGYQDWYNNFVNKCGLEPADYLKEMAKEYYAERDKVDEAMKEMIDNFPDFSNLSDEEDDYIRDCYMMNFQADDWEE